MLVNLLLIRQSRRPIALVLSPMAVFNITTTILIVFSFAFVFLLYKIQNCSFSINNFGHHFGPYMPQPGVHFNRSFNLPIHAMTCSEFDRSAIFWDDMRRENLLNHILQISEPAHCLGG